MILDFTRTSTCANGAKWSALDATTQVLVVTKRTVNYDDAIDCCLENFGELIRLETSEKMRLLSDHLTGLFHKSNR